MGNKRKWGAPLAAFIFSIVPLWPAALLVYLCLSLSSVDGEAEGMGTVFPIIFVGFITAILMMGMGIISVVLGIIAIRKPRLMGKTLTIVAIVLGILEIGSVAGFLLWIIPKIIAFRQAGWPPPPP